MHNSCYKCLSANAVWSWLYSWIRGSRKVRCGLLNKFVLFHGVRLKIMGEYWRRKAKSRGALEGLVCVSLPWWHRVFFRNTVVDELGIFLGMTFGGCFPPSPLLLILYGCVAKERFKRPERDSVILYNQSLLLCYTDSSIQRKIEKHNDILHCLFLCVLFSWIGMFLKYKYTVHFQNTV